MTHYPTNACRSPKSPGAGSSYRKRVSGRQQVLWKSSSHCDFSTFNSTVKYFLDRCQPSVLYTVTQTFNPVVNKQEHVTAVFAALADPTRRRIVERLSAHGESRVTALARPFHISLPAISKHLRVLERARLVSRHRHGREHLIRANTSGLKDAQKWIAQCAMFWESGFDALDELLRGEQTKGKKQ